VAGTLYFRIALVLVSVMTNSHQTGYFSISYRVVEVLFTVPGLLVIAAFPIFARAARDDPRRLAYAISRVFEVLLIIGVWISLVIAISAGFAIRVIGGAKFAPAADVLAVQGIAVGATFVGAVWNFALLSLHLHRLIIIYTLALLALVTCAVAALVPLDGAQGAAIGVAAAEVTGAIGGCVLLVRGRSYLKPRLGVLPKVAIAAVLAASPLLASGLGEVAQAIAATIIYCAVLLALKAPPEEVYDLLPARLRRRPSQT
jgi:O-antigen/teichoic acid export membrane protein